MYISREILDCACCNVHVIVLIVLTVPVLCIHHQCVRFEDDCAYRIYVFTCVQMISLLV